MGFHKFLKKIGKNFLIGICGGAVGIVVAVLYTLMVWLPVNSAKVGLAVVVVLPVMIILYSVLGAAVGGILSIIVYCLLGGCRKK